MAEKLITERLLRPREVAEILGVSRTQVYRLMEKEIPTVRFRGSVRVRPEDLDKFILDHLENLDNGKTRAR